jgi:hypothetical protein
MKLRDNLFVFCVGGVAATVLHLSCDGDSPPLADAAVQCDCPIAEAPLTGRLVRVTASRELPTLTGGGIGVACPAGDFVISGGCKAGTADSKHLLNSSYPSPPETPVGWACQFYNGTASPVTSEAYVLCLKPAP